MNFKRIGMALVSLVLVACLIVNVSPIKAEAASVGAGLTGWEILLFLISASAGILFNADIPTEPPAIIEAAETAFDNYVIGNYEFYFPDDDPDNDDDTDFEDFWDDFKNGVNECFENTGNFKLLGEYLPSDTFAEWLYSQSDAIVGSHSIGLGLKLRELLARWYMDIYTSGFFDVDVLVPYNDGFAYYNGVLLPDLSDSFYEKYPYVAVTISGEADTDTAFSHYLYASNYPLATLSEGSTRYIYNYSDTAASVYTGCLYISNPSVWASWGTGNYTCSAKRQIVGGISGDILWSNHDIVDHDGVYIAGSALSYPEESVSVSVEPHFFGDYADQNEAGTLTSDSFAFPAYDFSDFINDEDSVQENMQQVYEQISTGQMSYDDYMESITYDESIGDSSSGDSSSGDSSGSSGNSGSDNDYLTDKINALLEEYAFAASIVNTAKAIKTGLAGITTEPPVIYIHLENTRGPHNIGGTVPFLDLRWYAEYKPTVDTIISAFLWICFAWKMLLKLPGIISGMPGDFVMDSVHHIGMSEHMPVRKAEYEVQRVSSREYIRRGKDG